MIKTVTAPELAQWLQAGQAVVVDVREPDEYAAGHIEGATLIPVGQIALDRLPDAGGRKLVMQCRSGGRSHTACVKLLAQDPSLDVYNLAGGILDWGKAGLPVS